jgi:hypothetical protein
VSLRDEIVGSCQLCRGVGAYKDSSGSFFLCSCVEKFRAYNRLVDSGFSSVLLDFVSASEYAFPYFESGGESVRYWAASPDFVMQKGLSLYVYSSERGRGKTTLAHSLVYNFARHFQKTENYSRSRTYGFETAQDLQLNFEESELWKSTVYVLDDLGAESSESPWKKEAFLSTLQQVMHFRRNNNYPTIITTNYPPQFISNRYQKVLDSLLEIRPDGSIGKGRVFRAAEVGGAEDLRLNSDFTEWPES